MRRLYADREEKRVTRGSDISGQDGEQEQLDVNYPNKRSLLMSDSLEFCNGWICPNPLIFQTSASVD